MTLTDKENYVLVEYQIVKIKGKPLDVKVWVPPTKSPKYPFDNNT